MLKIYFDGYEVGADWIRSFTQQGTLFDNNFKLGSTLCRTFNLEVDKRIKRYVDSLLITDDGKEIATNSWESFLVRHKVGVESYEPKVVTIEDDNGLYATLYVDEINKDLNYAYKYRLVDKMVQLNREFIYDTSAGYTVKQLVNKICANHNILLVNTNFYMEDLVVSWTQEGMTERDFISYVAEVNGGYACINAEGNLVFKTYSKTPKQNINVEDCSSFSFGTHHIIDRFYVELATATKYYPESTDNETCYLNANNILFTDSGSYTIDGIVRHIYDVVGGLDFYNITVAKCPLNEGLISGDLISFTLDGVAYNMIVQIDWTFSAHWIGGYNLNLESAEQQETQIISPLKRIGKEIRIVVDREIGLIKQEVKEVSEELEVTNQELADTNKELTETKKTLLENYSTTEQTASAITTKVNASKTEILSDVANTYVTKTTLENYSTTEQTASAITLSVNASKTEILGEVSNTYATKASLSVYVKEDEASGKVVSWINASADNIVLNTKSLIFGELNDQYITVSNYMVGNKKAGVLFDGTGQIVMYPEGQMKIENRVSNVPYNTFVMNHVSTMNEINLRNRTPDSFMGNSIFLASYHDTNETVFTNYDCNLVQSTVRTAKEGNAISFYSDSSKNTINIKNNKKPYDDTIRRANEIIFFTGDNDKGDKENKISIINYDSLVSSNEKLNSIELNSNEGLRIYNQWSEIKMDLRGDAYFKANNTLRLISDHYNVVIDANNTYEPESGNIYVNYARKLYFNGHEIYMSDGVLKYH